MWPSWPKKILKSPGTKPVLKSISVRVLFCVLVQALQDADTASASKFSKRPQAKNLRNVTNHNDSNIKEGVKTSGETTVDYTHLTGYGENEDYSDKPSKDEALM